MLTKEPSQRQFRVSNLIKQALIEVLRKGKRIDPRLLDNNVTISDVQVSADLKIATCYVIPFGGKMSREDLLDALEQSKYEIRAMVTGKLDLKYSPELRFKYDSSFEVADQVHNILKHNASDEN